MGHPSRWGDGSQQRRNRPFFAVPGPIFDTQVRKGSYSNFAPKMADSGMAGRPRVTRQSCHTIAEEPAEPHSTIWGC